MDIWKRENLLLPDGIQSLDCPIHSLIITPTTLLWLQEFFYMKKKIQCTEITAQADLTQYNIAVFRRKHYIHFVLFISVKRKQTVQRRLYKRMTLPCNKHIKNLWATEFGTVCTE